jgi:hypothetical protein
MANINVQWPSISPNLEKTFRLIEEAYGSGPAAQMIAKMMAGDPDALGALSSMIKMGTSGQLAPNATGGRVYDIATQEMNREASARMLPYIQAQIEHLKSMGQVAQAQNRTPIVTHTPEALSFGQQLLKSLAQGLGPPLATELVGSLKRQGESAYKGIKEKLWPEPYKSPYSAEEMNLMNWLGGSGFAPAGELPPQPNLASQYGAGGNAQVSNLLLGLPTDTTYNSPQIVGANYPIYQPNQYLQPYPAVNDYGGIPGYFQGISNWVYGPEATTIPTNYLPDWDYYGASQAPSYKEPTQFEQDYYSTLPSYSDFAPSSYDYANSTYGGLGTLI